jgi:hypothetical protein
VIELYLTRLGHEHPWDDSAADGTNLVGVFDGADQATAAAAAKGPGWYITATPGRRAFLATIHVVPGELTEVRELASPGVGAPA